MVEIRLGCGCRERRWNHWFPRPLEKQDLNTNLIFSLFKPAPTSSSLLILSRSRFKPAPTSSSLLILSRSRFTAWNQWLESIFRSGDTGSLITWGKKKKTENMTILRSSDSTNTTKNIIWGTTVFFFSVMIELLFCHRVHYRTFEHLFQGEESFKPWFDPNLKRSAMFGSNVQSFLFSYF